jgi:hypothetical protein
VNAAVAATTAELISQENKNQSEALGFTLFFTNHQTIWIGIFALVDLSQIPN